MILDAFASWREFLLDPAGLVAVVGCLVFCSLAVEFVRRRLQAREEGHLKLLLEARKVSAAAAEQPVGGQPTNRQTSPSGQAKSGSGKPDAAEDGGDLREGTKAVWTVEAGENWERYGGGGPSPRVGGPPVPDSDEVDRLRQDSKQLAEVVRLLSGCGLTTRDGLVAFVGKLASSQRVFPLLVKFVTDVIDNTRTSGFDSIISRTSSGQASLVGEDDRLRSALEGLARRVGNLRLRTDRLDELVLAVGERLVVPGRVEPLKEETKRDFRTALRDSAEEKWKGLKNSFVGRLWDWGNRLEEARGGLSKVEEALGVQEAVQSQPSSWDSGSAKAASDFATRNGAIVAGIGALKERIAASEEGIANLVALVERRCPVRCGGGSHGGSGIDSLGQILDELIAENERLDADKENLLERLVTAASLMKELNTLPGFSFGVEEGADAAVDTLLLTDDVARQFYEEKFEEGVKGGFRWEARMLRRDGKLVCHLRLSLLRNTSIAALPSSARVWFVADDATNFGGLFVAETTREPAEFEAPYKAIARMFEIARSKLVVDVRPLPGRTGVYKTMATVDSRGE